MTRVQDRPFLEGTFTTDDLPATPMRDARIPGDAWVDAPAELLELGAAIGARSEYKRRIGRFLLWRAGPPVGEARYLAIDPDTGELWRFELHGRQGVGVGPDGRSHTRFRTWKEALRDAEPPK